MATQVTWHGHAAIGIETGGKNLLFDPYLTGNPAATAKPDALAPDYILISHGHNDHIGDALGIAKRTGTMIISNFDLIAQDAHAWAERVRKATQGRTRAVVLSPGESFSL